MNSSDARTLLATPRKRILKDITPGQYCHFGVANCIEILFSYLTDQNLNSIQVYINIDGLPISKSSNSQFYPILCSLVENRNFVDMIGIYHGLEKPTFANEFLKDFVDEVILLTNNGITINGRTYSFKIKAFICDTPAKAFIMYAKGHTGYFSCSKCQIEGTFVDNRVCFPNIKNLVLRTDIDFRNKVQEEHYLGTSILELIPNLNMINDIA
ncbi:hypothetical protein NQ314_003936 [Rhamnusium bicolor]|uniref:Transposase domain-containing protein n=1 Tax=Rhamnusium bicolor TaxID=1586634 RepID=A0AAV8ZMM6_9CUCU|nr:hypothetical protein NQ314_003936 [Rhamnusium bicolor]